MSSKAHRHHIFETKKKQADKTLLMKEILTKFRDVLGHQDTRVSAIWTGQKRHRKKAGKSRVLWFATMWAKWHFSLNCLSCESPWLISLWFEFFKKSSIPRSAARMRQDHTQDGVLLLMFGTTSIWASQLKAEALLKSNGMQSTHWFSKSCIIKRNLD